MPVLEQPLTAPAREEFSRYRPRQRDECLARLQKYFDEFAPRREHWRRKNLGYYLELERLYRYYVPPDSSVLEIGCGAGHLLAALKPARGLGVDLSPAMIALAREKYPQLQFEV